MYKGVSGLNLSSSKTDKQMVSSVLFALQEVTI